MVCTSSGMRARVREGNKKLIKQLLNVMKNMCAQMAGRTNYLTRNYQNKWVFHALSELFIFFGCWGKEV